MKKKIEKNWLEWAVFGVALALVAGALGFLIYDGATSKGAPPQFEITLDAAEQRGQNFVVPVRVTNTGDETAEGVHVEVTLEGGGGAEAERGEFVIGFLPRQGTREGSVNFHADPRAGGNLRARVLGYEKP